MAIFQAITEISRARNTRAALLLSSALLSSTAALADAPPPAPSNDTTAPAIEEIVVTSQKVVTNLQKTPLAVSVISGAALDQNHIVAPKDLDTIIPGLVVNTTPSNPLSITIRGSGFEGIENTSAQPGVSYNQNGVYIASPISLNANFLDVERVEVLRGPQGTVLGQNSDGGAINVTTVRPKLGVTSGDLDLSGGSYAYDRVRALANVPIGDTIAVRIALQQEAHHGWAYATEVPGTNGHYPLSNEASVNGRIDILWKPTEKLTFEAWAEHYRNNTNGDAVKNINDPNPDPRVLTQDYPTKTNQASDNIALNASYDFGFATLKAIGSYQWGKLDNIENLDKLDYANAIATLGVHDIDVANNREGYSYTAEVDLVSKPGTKLSWIIGGFYLYQKYHEQIEEYQYNNSAANQAAYAAGDYNQYAAFGLPFDLTPNNPYVGETAGFSGPIAFETQDTQKLKSASFYAQGVYHFTDAFRATVGARGTLDNQLGVVQDYFGLTDRNNGATSNNLQTRFGKVTARAELEYDITPTNTIYAMYSDGIKPGGANLNPGAFAVPEIFALETVDAFEIGSKNEFFDKHLRINLSAFYNIVHNFQVDSEDPIPFDGGLTNVRKAHVDGLEAEATAILPEGFRADGNLTVQHSKVESHENLLNPSIAEGIDYANGGAFNNNDVAQRFAAYYASTSDVYGHQLPKTPPFTVNLTLQKKFTFNQGDTLTGSIHGVYRSAYFFRIYNDPSTDRVPNQHQFDLNISYKMHGGHWHADFSVINLANSNAISSRYSDNFGTFVTANYYVPPRQFLGRIGYSF